MNNQQYEEYQDAIADDVDNHLEAEAIASGNHAMIRLIRQGRERRATLAGMREVRSIGNWSVPSSRTPRQTSDVDMLARRLRLLELSG